MDTGGTQGTRLPQKDGLELQHARNGQQHGRVLRHEGGAGQDGVATRREEVLATSSRRKRVCEQPGET
jgi:hypothetical protein